MPSVAAILAQLAAAAADAKLVAIAWHALLAVGAIALWRGYRPSQRLAAQLLCAPLASVALVAAAYRSPFNAAVLGLTTLALFVLARRGEQASVQLAAPPVVALGLVMTALGWTYPHFLEGSPTVTYLYAAPLGVVPCATLYAVVGLALLGGGLASRAWTGLLAVVALFYGVFGVLRLGVRLDLGLIVGAAVLGELAVRTQPRAGAWPSMRHLSRP
jgi:hypothetical protein